MGKKHFTEEQIAYALRQQEAGTPVAELTRTKLAHCIAPVISRDRRAVCASPRRVLWRLHDVSWVNRSDS